ncbi:MAG: YjbF family lipoprotein [bacterium]
MGAVLEMRIICAAALGVVAASMLTACGNDTTVGELKAPLKVLFGAVGLGKKVEKPALFTMDANQTAALRAVLVKNQQPIYEVSNANLNYINLMAPYGENGDVVTWSSTSFEMMSLRHEMVVATRGFGQDLMSAQTPGLAQIATGHGSTSRSYYYLNGADKPVRLDYTCVLAPAGNDSIVVLGKAFSTRKVTETCTGPADGFTNSYWFDHGLHLRQSSQRVAPALGNLLMQRVID